MMDADWDRTDPTAAFARRTGGPVHTYRRFPYRDPGLPIESCSRPVGWAIKLGTCSSKPTGLLAVASRRALRDARCPTISEFIPGP